LDQQDGFGEQIDLVQLGGVVGRDQIVAVREHDVEVALGECWQALLRFHLEQAQVQVGMLRAQRHQRRWQQGAGGRRERGQSDLAADGAARCGKIGLGALELGEHDLGVGDQHLGGAGEADRASPAVDQPRGRFALQRAQLLGDRRVCVAEVGGRGGDTASGRDLLQYAQASHVEHVSNTNLSA